MTDDEIDPPWIVNGGWRRVNEDVPAGVILETVQLIGDLQSAPNLKSFQGGRWPVGNWHWEPEGHVCSCEPSHWRKATLMGAEAALEAAAPLSRLVTA